MSFLIRKSSDQSLRATPRSLSQLITSFIGSWCQGIPLALFLAWPRRNQHPLHSVSVASSRCRRKLHSAPLFLLSNSNPLTPGFEFVRDAVLGSLLFLTQSTILEKSMLLVLYYSWIMQAHYRISVFLAKIVFLPLQMIFKMSICKTFSLLLPSHNCIIIHNVQFSRCIWVSFLKRLNEASSISKLLQSIPFPGGD